MKITSETMYTVNFTKGEWFAIEALIRNIKQSHVRDLGCTDECSDKIWGLIVGMRERLNNRS